MRSYFLPRARQQARFRFRGIMWRSGTSRTKAQVAMIVVIDQRSELIFTRAIMNGGVSVATPCILVYRMELLEDRP